MGDFSILPNLPKMYLHCKETEDCDMTVLDFFTDHLINIDGLFDHHDNGDDQKPHQPFHYQNINIQLFTVSTQEITFETHKKNNSFKKESTLFKEADFQSEFISRLFKPPIV